MPVNMYVGVATTLHVQMQYTAEVAEVGRTRELGRETEHELHLEI
jgi:hypothetical protein